MIAKGETRGWITEWSGLIDRITAERNTVTEQCVNALIAQGADPSEIVLETRPGFPETLRYGAVGYEIEERWRCGVVGFVATPKRFEGAP